MHETASRKIGPTFWLLVFTAAFTATRGEAQTPPAPRALVLDGAGPWQDARWSLGVTQLTSLLTDAGYQIGTVSPADLASPPASDVLLAAPSLESLPLAAFKAVAAFLAAGGSLMASGGEPFRDPLYPASNGSWIDQVSLLQALTPAKTVLNPATATLSEAFYVPEPITRATVIGPDGQAPALDFQLQISTAQFYLLTAPVAAPAFNAGQTATVVWTRGTPGQSMMFEWDETDGSRWIAIVPLTAQWTKQVLLPSAFRYYAGPPARAATTFNPALASLLYFGVATNLGALPGPMEFALGSIGVASTPPTFEAFTPPLLETLSPWYKQYVTERAGQSVRVPITRGRGLSATPDPDGRYRAIGDLLSPAATWYVKNSGTAVIWLPWPQLQDPDRAQLVTQLRAAPNRLYLMNAGPAQIVTLPSEDLNLGARILNAGPSSAAANLQWSISDSTGTAVARFTSALSVAAGGLLTVPAADVGRLPPGDYSITASLTVAAQEIDRIDGKVRVVRPTSEFQPDQRITVANGAFSTGGGRPLFLQGVNYWPRYTAALEPARFYQSWLSPQNYDPDVVEADLGLLASLNFNMVSIHYFGTGGARPIVDFLDRCRRHGIWVDISIDAFGGVGVPSILDRGQLLGINSPYITALLQSAFLTDNDRVLAFSLLSEPFLGFHSDRLSIDSAWRAWITDQYGTAANAENTWGFSAPRDAQGQISNPLDSQIQNDGPWRGMVAAYRRFIDDFLSRSIGAAARLVRSISPGTLISYRNGGSAAVNADYSLLGEGLTMMQEMNYDFGTAAAHLDFIAPHAYFIPIPWPDGRGLGVEAAYARYRSGGKPVYWTEYGINIGDAGLGMATQAATCDSVMRLVSEDGSGAAAAWWMPGGWRPDEASDYGIVNPDGSPRQCATILSQWGATFQTMAPAQPAGNPVEITIDRDADARGDVGVFLRWQKDYVTARQAGSPAVLVDAGTGTDTSTMPLAQVGNFSYGGSGPLKYANGEFAGIHLQCPGVDVRAENGDQVKVPAGSACQITMTLVNTGAAAWLPAARGNRGVVLHTSAGDLPLTNPLEHLQRTDFGPLPVTVGESEVDITGRLSIQGLGPLGETLRLSLVSGARSSIDVPITAGGAVSNSTLGTSAAVQAGFAALSVKLGFAPYGTAVFSFKQSGVTVSEAGIPASAPTTSARIFIDYRSAVPALPGRIDAGSIDVDTGVAVVNNGQATANVVYTLRGTSGATLSVGHGTIAAGTHFARFINQLTDVAPDLSLPSDFPTAIQFASLEISSDQPLSIAALRGTTSQRNDFLFTTTPIADLTRPAAIVPAYFPQLVDGGGYVTALVLLNTSSEIETGTLQLKDDKGAPLAVNQAGGGTGSSFSYSIPPGGLFRFQTDGSPAAAHVGWAQLMPDAGTSTPVGAGVFSYNPGSVLITESGIPAAAPTTHARIYVDLSGNHDTGVAIANLSSASASITIRAFQNDGVTVVGASPAPLQLTGSGHSAEFAGQFVTGLPVGFTGVLDVASKTPFAALTIRSLTNERGDFLLTTFPIADENQIPPSSIVFPQIADGGGFVTEFVLLSAGGASSTTLSFFGETGTPLVVGK